MHDSEPVVEQVAEPSGAGYVIRGILHQPRTKPVGSLLLTHGAGGNANSALLVALANEFAEAGVAVLRYDLPFRQLRPHGPPSPSSAPKDREGLRGAADVLRKRLPGRLVIGGQSYGGRQATLLAAEDPSVCDGLLLLSYPLHPPGRANQLRTSHFPQLRVPALFVQGSRDPFGSPEEIESALQLLQVRHGRVLVEGAGHDLGWSRARSRFSDVPNVILGAFQNFFRE